jgi:molybdopterin-guanine dinucleotide biosynthesis protein A
MTRSRSSEPRIATTGVVLAGGRSSRFRGGPSGGSKLDLDLAGATVLERTIAALAGVVDEVVVVGRSGAQVGSSGARVGSSGARVGSSGARVGSSGARVGSSGAQVGSSGAQVPALARIRYLDDREPYAGPLAGLLAGLEAAAGRTVVVAGGDMPLLRVNVLRLLMARLADPPLPDAAGLASGDDLQPLPLALRRDPARAAAVATLAADERSLRAFLGRLTRAVVPEAAWRALDPGGDTVRDIDTPGDLEVVRRAWASAGRGGSTN